MQQPQPRPSALILAIGVPALSMVAGLGCPGNLDPHLFESPTGAAGMSGNPPPCDAEPIMFAKCGAIGCHNDGNTNSGGLDLRTADMASRLVGVASTGDNLAKCEGGMIYLNPNTTPATGLFIDKLTTPTCGDPMPLQLTITDTARECIITWANFYTAP